MSNEKPRGGVDSRDFKITKLTPGVDFYLEQGRYVFTSRYHLNRGYCCNSGCRHCPYQKGPKIAGPTVAFVGLPEGATQATPTSSYQGMSGGAGGGRPIPSRREPPAEPPEVPNRRFSAEGSEDSLCESKRDDEK